MTLEEGHGEARGIALTRVWPEIAGIIPAEDHQIAARVLTVPLLTGDGEQLCELVAVAAPKAYDFVVAEGLVLKETNFNGRAALELLGPGDVIAPPLTALRQLESRAVSRYIAHGPASLAVIDERFRQAARRWPGLSDLLLDRMGRQTHRASMHLATLHQTRVEERIMSLFIDLGERLGRMTPDGVIVDIPLTHELIGRLVGAQRPTVSLALTGLGSSGALARLDNHDWRVAPDAMTA